MWLVIPVLRASRIAHGSLQAPSVIVGPDGAVTLVGFGAGSEAANPDQLDGDIADLLVSTAAIFGPGRAVDAAVDALRRPQMAAVMARLQPLALSRLTQAVLRRHKGLLDELRRHLAQETGAANDAVQRPVRVAVGNLVPLGAALFAVNLLLPRVSQVGATVTTLHHADGRWLPAIIAAAAATYPMAAVALTGAADRALVFGRTLAVQMAAAFTNRLAPAGLGGMATNVRYLELSGSSRPAAVNAVVLTSAAGLFVHLVAGIAVGLALGFERGPTAPHPPALPPHWPALLVVAAVIIAAGIPLWGRALRRLIVPHLAQLRDAVAGLRRHPKSIAQLVGGSAGITASHTVALIACTKAFGLGLPALDVAGIYLAATAVAALAPTPGGVGALEAVLVAALTEAGGATGAAVAAVLTYRLATYWLPIVPGAATFYTLRHRQDL